MTRSAKTTIVVAFVAAGLVGTALGNEPKVPEEWKSLDHAGLKGLALQFRSQGTAGEQNLKLLAEYVASKYATESAAGPIEWNEWIDLAYILGARFPKDTQAAMGQDIKRHVVPNEEAALGLSAEMAAKVSIALFRLNQAKGEIVEHISEQGRAQWIAKLKSFFGAEGRLVTLAGPDVRGLVLGLRLHGDRKGAAAMAKTWLSDAHIQSTASSFDMALTVLGVPRNDKAIAAEAIAPVGDVLLARHAAAPLDWQPAKFMAYAYRCLLDGGNACKWALSLTRWPFRTKRLGRRRTRRSCWTCCGWRRW